MANTQIIDLILQTTAEMFTYMLPILGLMTGIIFIASFLYSVTIGAVKKI